MAIQSAEPIGTANHGGMYYFIVVRVRWNDAGSGCRRDDLGYRRGLQIREVFGRLQEFFGGTLAPTGGPDQNVGIKNHPHAG